MQHLLGFLQSQVFRFVLAYTMLCANTSLVLDDLLEYVFLVEGLAFWQTDVQMEIPISYMPISYCVATSLDSCSFHKLIPFSNIERNIIAPNKTLPIRCCCYVLSDSPNIFVLLLIRRHYTVFEFRDLIEELTDIFSCELQ